MKELENENKKLDTKLKIDPEGAGRLQSKGG